MARNTSHPYKGSTNGKRRDRRAVVKDQARAARREDGKVVITEALADYYEDES